MQVDMITYQLWCTTIVLMTAGVSWSRDGGSLPLTAAATSRSVPECSSCENLHERVVDTHQAAVHRWTMPLVSLGDKQYYLGIFFKANWYKAYQFCRFHGLHLVSIESLEENTKLEEFIKSQGLFNEHFWTSGTDQGDEGKFFWMGTGRPISFTNWNAGEPNNFRYENGEEEHCLELWNRDGKGLKWNDTPCSFETYFLCEKQD